MKKMVFENWTENKLSKQTSNSFRRLNIKTQSNLSKEIKLFIESLILAQDERWRRA